MVHDNYYRCYYNGDPKQVVRKDIHDRWEPHFSNDILDGRHVLTFQQETHIACGFIFDKFRKYTKKVNLFFSGGMDSECLLRSFCYLKIPVNPIVLVHVHEPKSNETLNAFAVCKELGLVPTIFKVDLPTLYNSGVLHDLGRKYQTARLGQLELIYVMTKLSIPCILADDIQMVYQSTGEDLLHTDAHETKYQQWLYEVREDEDGLYNRYEALTGIPTIADSFRYTPHLWASMILAKDIRQLIAHSAGRVSSYSTKNIMMSKEFSVPNREKTNVFSFGPHFATAKALREDLEQELFPFTIARLPYKQLLTTLGINYEM